MIISVSRRTDIPGNYPKWFINRIKKGYVLKRNPMNFKQVSQISLRKEDVSCFVFWTKNPAPLIEYLDELEDYNYYFQVTVTPYQKDIEKTLPFKKDILKAFKRLSRKIGSEKVVWRYDPILFNEKYTREYHLHYFEVFCKSLSTYTNTCIFSFIESYKKIEVELNKNNIRKPEEIEKIDFVKNMLIIANKYSIKLKTCASSIKYENVDKSSCIDGSLIEKLYKINVTKEDSNQRDECKCITSVDIGAYNTCNNGCIYCYANNANIIKTKDSEDILGIPLRGDEKINIKKVKKQISK